MEEVGFVDHFVEANAEPVEELDVVAEGIPNLIDTRMEVGFHDPSVGYDMEIGSNMEIIKHSVMDDTIVVGGELYIA